MGNTNAKGDGDHHRTTLDRDVYNIAVKNFQAFTSKLDENAFEKFSAKCLDEKFRPIVFKCVTSFGKEHNHIEVKSFIRFAEMVFGDYDQQAQLLINFAQPLRKIVEGIVSSFLICEERPNDDESVKLLVDYIIKSAPTSSPSYQKEDLSHWLMHCEIFPIIWKRVFEALILNYNNKILPHIKGGTLLTSAAQCVITLMLPLESRYQWKLLFSSRTHGESFSKMLNAVNGTGACLVIIETTSGRVFGGFANDGFVCGPSYRGDVTCFLFEDRTNIAIHSATGFNQNFAYLNYMQQTLPNGLGIGGTDDNWSMFLCEEFGKGISSSNISTFEKCWLAGQNEFHIKNVEIWRIGKARRRRRYDSEGNEIIEKEISALDRDPEATAVLELSGKRMHSEGLREPPRIDDD